MIGGKCMDKNILTQEKIRSIFNDTYNNFYIKYKDVSNPDWDNLLDEARQINKKHNCKLCRGILVELVNALEQEHMQE